MIYVLAYPKFSKKVGRAIAEFRAEHEPERAAMVRAHITLVFGLSGLNENEFCEQCRQVAIPLEPIEFSFSNILIHKDPVEHNYKLVANVDTGTDKITKVHNAMYVGPQSSQLRSDIPYQPHMTIATNSKFEQIEAIKTRSLSVHFPLSGVIERIGVVRLEQNIVTKMAEIYLKK